MKPALTVHRKWKPSVLLAGGVAHDLNNILSGIVSYPEFLLLELPEDSPFREPIATIKRSGEKAATIVQDLLTLARRGVHVREAVNLSAIIKDYMASLEFANLCRAYPDIKLKHELDETLFNFIGSSVHLSKLIMNLVANAFEAIQDIGEVFIQTVNKHIDRPIPGYADFQKGDYVVLSVTDNGIGMSEQDIQRIFEPFYTKKVMARSGTGLGMAVVWGTVRDHRGHIDVDSKINEGTTITVCFPVPNKVVTRPTKVDINLTDIKGNGETVLVIDDVQEQRLIASSILKKLNYSVQTVPSGEAALDYLRENKADLLVMDMVMDPGMDGLDTYKQVLSHYPNQKAIIASGFSETVRVKEAMDLGAGTYVKKPYRIITLGSAVYNELNS